MSAALDVVKAATDALEAGDLNRLRQLLTDDFVFINPYGAMPEIDANQWLGLNQMMHNAFSDLTYNFEMLEERGYQVWVSVAFEGTFDGDLDLSPMGGTVIAPSGKQGQSARSVTVATVNDAGQIESIEVIEEQEGGGPMGLLASVGVNIN